MDNEEAVKMQGRAVQREEEERMSGCIYIEDKESCYWYEQDCLNCLKKREEQKKR